MGVRLPRRHRGGRAAHGGWRARVRRQPERQRLRAQRRDGLRALVLPERPPRSVLPSASAASRPTAGSRAAAFIGDRAANVYAVDAGTGELLWKTTVDTHPVARVTGSPVFHNGRLYVPVASGEEGAGAISSYECCRFRGSLVALDGATGEQIWKTYTIAEASPPDAEEQGGHADVGPVGRAHLDEPDDRSREERGVRHDRATTTAIRRRPRATRFSRSISRPASSCGRARRRRRTPGTAPASARTRPTARHRKARTSTSRLRRFS